jgi:hypothetical protein
MKVFEIKGHQVLVDDEDAHWLENMTWYLIEARQLTQKYYIAHMAYKGTTVYLHRVVMEAARGEIVDHINGNTLDCRRENLRITNQTVNRINCVVRANKKSSKFKGVFKNKRGSSKPYYSMIQLKGNTIWLGTFTTEQEAAEAYNKKIAELFPELAA